MSVPTRSDQLPLGALPPTAANWCHLTSKIDKFDFEWTIHNFELTDYKYEPIESAVFTSGRPDDEIAWMLWYDNDKGIKIDHCLTSQAGKESQDLKIQWYEGSYCRDTFRVTTAIVNKGNEKVSSCKTLVRQDTDMPIIVNPISREIIQSRVGNLLVNGNLTIYCQIETLYCRQNLLGKTAQVSAQTFQDKSQLLKHLEELFESKKFCDVSFNVQGQILKAHKNILVARSLVFSAMFDHSFIEKLTSIVDVPDIEPEVFHELLRFIYTGQVPDDKMDEKAFELLTAADKYLLKELKLACGNYLLKHMSPDICMKLLLIPENNAAYYLREKALDYIRQFPVLVKATNSWKKVAKENPAWIVSILEMLLETYTFS